MRLEASIQFVFQTSNPMTPDTKHDVVPTREVTFAGRCVKHLCMEGLKSATALSAGFALVAAPFASK